MEHSFFTETVIQYKTALEEYPIRLKEITNPFKRFSFKRKIKKMGSKYLDILKNRIFNKEMDIQFIYDFILFSSLVSSIDYREKKDVFDQLEEIKVIYKKEDKPYLVIFLYLKRKEIRFAKYVEETMIQYPRHVFINSVTKENAVYEYDEEMIHYIREFIWQNCIEYLGDDLKCI